MRAVLLLAALCVNSCAKSFEAKTDFALARSVDTKEPVAVPQRFSFHAVVPGGSSGTLILSTPGVTPLELNVADAGVSIDGEIDYGPPRDKTTHEQDGMKLKEDDKGKSAPIIPSLFGIVFGHWGLIALISVVGLLIGALLVFRRSALVQRLAGLLPWPFSLLALAVATDTPK